MGLAAGRGPGSAEASNGLRILARMPSFFGYLRVVETRQFRMLTVNGIGQNYVPLLPGVKSSAYLDFIGALPRLHATLPAHPSALLIGLGAGQLVRALEASGALLTVVEIDSRVEQAARRYFGLELPHQRVHVEDGRAFLERDTATYDLVVMDAFLGEDVPGHLYTREALAAIRRRLSPGGLLAVNYTSFPDGRDARSLARTLRAEFPNVRAYNDGSRSTELASNVFVASTQPFALGGIDAAADSSAGVFLANEAHFPEAGALLLTDDYNPINVFRLGANRIWRKAMVNMIGDDRAYWTDF
jgi:spermidine synthase